MNAFEHEIPDPIAGQQLKVYDGAALDVFTKVRDLMDSPLRGAGTDIGVLYVGMTWSEIKIGKTCDLGRRSKEHGIRIWRACVTAGVSDLERHVLALMGEPERGKEWFRLSEERIDALCSKSLRLRCPGRAVQEWWDGHLPFDPECLEWGWWRRDLALTA